MLFVMSQRVTKTSRCVFQCGELGHGRGGDGGGQGLAGAVE